MMMTMMMMMMISILMMMMISMMMMMMISVMMMINIIIMMTAEIIHLSFTLIICNDRHPSAIATNPLSLSCLQQLTFNNSSLQQY